MIAIKRLPKPSKLAEKESEWLKAFLKKRANNPKARPPSNRCRHPDILHTLQIMSSGKCFYCECKLLETEQQVEHYIAIEENEALAFTWDNLYLSCERCNQAKRKKEIDIIDCVDPCDPNDNPANHLTFNDEYILSKNKSQRGSNTIKKYELGRDDLNYKRMKALHHCERRLRKLRERQLREGKRQQLTIQEKDIINRFKSPEHPFSLMFSVYLAQLDL